MNETVPVNNPYAKDDGDSGTNTLLGRQSQHRNSLQKWTFNLAKNNYPSKKQKGEGEQQTLFGQTVFKAEKDCQVCKARALALTLEGVRIPKRPHHPLCLKNTKTKGKGVLSVLAKASLEDNKQYKAATAAIRPEEGGSWSHSTKEAGEKFFQQRKIFQK
jgi:hypothetical protein